MKLSTNEIRITSLQEAQNAIRILKMRVKLREQDLELRLQQLPKESLKSAMGLVIPAFVSSRITGSTWSIIKDVAGLLSPFSSNKSKFLIDIGKQVGVVGLFKAFTRILKK